MAIAIKNIPVLTGKDADYFNHLVEEANDAPVTYIPDSMKVAFKTMEERLHDFVKKGNLK